MPEKNAENVMDGILWNRTHFQYYNSEYIGELEFAFIQPNDWWKLCLEKSESG